MFTYYYKTSGSVGESCDRQMVRTRKEEICYHCRKVIPADRNAVKLKMTGGINRVYLQLGHDKRCETRILHIACARKACS